MAKKKEEVNLSEIDASFVISSFKNKERRNNPSSIPRPLLPPDKEVEQETEPEEPETPVVIQVELPVRNPSASEVSRPIMKACSLQMRAYPHEAVNWSVFGRSIING